MATFIRSSIDFNASNTLQIVTTETVENYTVYVIQIVLGQHRWLVSHRYSEFHLLHEKLAENYKLEKALLPPKKLFGNQSENFIRKRQAELQIYLQTLLLRFSSIPVELQDFLYFHKYEIHGITQSLAVELFHKGDLILQANETFHTSPLQLHAISTRLQLAEPTCESGDTKKDLGHILDFITSVRSVKIVGEKNVLGTSNICVNDLSFDLLSFKSLQALELVNCSAEKISGVDHIKKCLRRLKVQQSVRAIREVLLMDVALGLWMGTDNEAVLVPAWSSLASADFSNNSINSIDESVKLLPRVEYLDLSGNQLAEIQHLEHLSTLTHVDLSYNAFRSLQALHMRLGNIKTLNLAGNKLETLAGFSKLYSLQSLDVSHNDISQVMEVRHISSLPCLEKLDLSRNPVTIVLDYRTKVLALFAERAREVSLDKQQPTQKELDTVAVLQAIQKSKDSIRSGKPRHKVTAKEATIAESGSSEGQSSSAQTQVVTSTATTTLTLADLATIVDTNPSGSSTVAHVSQRSQPAGADSTSPPPGAVDSQTRQEVAVVPTSNAPPAPVTLGYQFSLDLPNSPAGTMTGLMLPETLPSKNNTGFVSSLQGLLPDTHSHRSRLGGRSREQREERPVHLIWCSVICYTNPFHETPACVFITTENLHVFEVVLLRGDDDGAPMLSHLYCVPLVNIQQMVLGYQSQYVRVEEAFVGPQGTFTLLTASTNKTDLFLDSLKLAYRRAIPDLDQYEDPHVVINGETDVKLRQTLNRIEGVANADDIKLILYMLVNTIDYTHNSKPFVTHSLVVTSKYLYLLREDYVLWPQPTFAIGPSSRPQFEVACAFPVMGHITGIQMYDSDTYSPEADSSLSQNFSATKTGTMLAPNFIGFGVQLTFDLGAQGQQRLDLRVSTSGMRDKFLATLTQVRRELSTSPPKVKGKKGSKHHEVEGDSLSSSSAGSGPGKRPKQRKHKGSTLANRDHRSRDRQRKMDLQANASAKTSVQGRTPAQDSHEQDITHSTSVLKDLESSDEVPYSYDLPCRDSPTGESSSTFESVSEGSTTSDKNEQDFSHGPTKGVEKADDTARGGGVVPTIHKVSPPASLDVMYPSLQLLSHLTEHNERVPLPNLLSSQMSNLAAMMGDELVNFFHGCIAEINLGSEELRHVMWTSVAVLSAPLEEVPALIMLSTRAIYAISDQVPRKKSSAAQHLKTHARNKSDSFHMLHAKPKAVQHVAGIIESCDGAVSKLVRPYCILPLRDLKQVNYGLFDQTLRLTGNALEKVFTCITRDQSLTTCFARELMNVLMLVLPSPSPDFGNSGSEQDFYKMFNRETSSGDGDEFKHPSKVRFRYPSEESITDLTYLVVNHIRGKRPKESECNLLLYLLVLKLPPAAEDGGDFTARLSLAKSRTLIVTEKHIALAVEDHVSFPIPEFCTAPPGHKQLETLEVRPIETLKRIVVSDFASSDVTLVFADEAQEVIVDTSLDHFSDRGRCLDACSQAVPVPEVVWMVVLCNLNDKDKFLRQISEQWRDSHEGSELSIQVSA